MEFKKSQYESVRANKRNQDQKGPTKDLEGPRTTKKDQKRPSRTEKSQKGLRQGPRRTRKGQ